jgi:hypothetical protein
MDPLALNISGYPYRSSEIQAACLASNPLRNARVVLLSED